MMTVPTAAVAAQSFGIVLAGQNCNMSIQQLNDSLYLSLQVSGGQILTNRVCLDRCLLVGDEAYRGFVGELMWIDTQGTDAPQAGGLGTRWQLIYLETADLA